jgi:hypothetical protein
MQKNIQSCKKKCSHANYFFQLCAYFLAEYNEHEKSSYFFSTFYHNKTGKFEEIKVQDPKLLCHVSFGLTHLNLYYN